MEREREEIEEEDMFRVGCFGAQEVLFPNTAACGGTLSFWMQLNVASYFYDTQIRFTHRAYVISISSVAHKTNKDFQAPKQNSLAPHVFEYSATEAVAPTVC